VGLFDFLLRRAPKDQAIAVQVASRGVLPILVGASTSLISRFDEDVSIYREAGLEIEPEVVTSVHNIKELINIRRPEVVHLVAQASTRGSLVDSTGAEVSVRELVVAAENSGASLFVIAGGVHKSFARDHLEKPRTISVLVIIERNHHFATFLRGLIAELAVEPKFALAFVKLAPQHEPSQRGRPLPGAIALCPAKPKLIVLWSEAQP
jgi:hypothetical protein